jgi:hypothetical protein
MAETTRREGGADAGWNLPTKHLPPPLGSRDLPDPLPLRKIIGASVIILATALGSGELILCCRRWVHPLLEALGDNLHPDDGFVLQRSRSSLSTPLTSSILCGCIITLTLSNL